MVNSLLAESCWGWWDEATHAAAARGLMDGPKLQAAASWVPQLSAPQVEAAPGLTTYSELLEDILKVSKTARVNLKTRFTDPGSPGERYRAHFDQLMQALTLPPNITLPDAPAAIGPGRHFMLPSFFEVVLALERAGRDFSIVFRTFGVDLPDVATEWNSFCTGNHPCYPGIRMDGSRSSQMGNDFRTLGARQKREILLFKREILELCSKNDEFGRLTDGSACRITPVSGTGTGTPAIMWATTSHCRWSTTRAVLWCV